MAEFQKAHWFTARWEGGISDHPNDPGGYTAFGVSTEFMKDFAANPAHRELLESMGLCGTVNRHYMKKIDSRMAARIFKAAFWDPHQLDGLDQAAATIIYDASVNHGLRTGLRIFQQALNNTAGLRLAVDGVMGPRTLAAAKTHGRKACQEAIALRIARYHNIVKARPSMQVFLKGWLNRANDLKAHVGKM